MSARPSTITNLRDAEPLAIALLGGFRVQVGQRVVEDTAWYLRRASSVVKLLALEPTHRLHREQLIDLLWPASDPDAASNSLRQTLHVARGILTAEVSQAPSLYRDGEYVVLGLPEMVWTDVRAFEIAVDDAWQTNDNARLWQAVDLYQGDLLPEDRYEDWAAPPRTRLRATYLTSLARLSRMEEERGELEQAVTALHRLVAVDPAHEAAHVDLMRLYALTARRTQALRQFQDLREALQHEFDLEPEPASVELYEAILAGRFPGDGAPSAHRVRSGPAHDLSEAQDDSLGRSDTLRGYLPAQLTSFIGREREAEELRHLLSQAPMAGIGYMPRLVTLTGPGGSGKTRLAIRVGEELGPSYTDGIWFVDLAAVTDPDLVPQAIATGLAVRERPGQDLVTTLLAALHDRQLLLLLDNCEQVVAACAALAEMLLRSCPGLHVLATSRERLGVAGELVWPVPPLAVPQARQQYDPNDSTVGRLDTIERIETVRLFTERARLVNPRFQLTEQDVPAMVVICTVLEGMPLAIELAAAQTRLLSVDQIAARLGHALSLLSGGPRTAPSRQQSLRAAIDWSYALLRCEEQQLFARLAVFAGSFTLDAVEAVCSGAPTALAKILALLSALVDKSLVSVVGRDGTARYRLLETIREFSLEQLRDHGQEADARVRHAAYYLALAEEANRELHGPQPTIWLAQLEAEHDNLRAALSWVLDSGSGEMATQLAGTLHWFWFTHGHVHEGGLWLERALSLNGASATTRVRALSGAGMLLWRQGETTGAASALEEAVALARAAGDAGGCAYALHHLAHIWENQGDFNRAREMFDESLALYRETSDRWGQALTRGCLGALLQHAGADDEALPLLEETLRGWRTLGVEQGVADMLRLLGIAAERHGDARRAVALLEESVVRHRDLGDRQGIAHALYLLGAILLHQRELRGAAAAFRESLALRWELSETPSVAECLEGLAGVACEDSDGERAARLLGAAMALRESLQMPLRPVDTADHGRVMGTTREALGDARFAACSAEGRVLPLEDAIAYALESTDAVGRLPDDAGQPAAVPERSS